MGDFLYVGVWADDVVNHYRGSNYPILSLNERVLMTLACRYVDDVVIGAPYEISEDLIKSLNISLVVAPNTKEDSVMEEFCDVDPFAAAKQLGIYKEYDLETDMTIEIIAERVVQNREKYRAKYENKKMIQDQYYNEKKDFVAEV